MGSFSKKNKDLEVFNEIVSALHKLDEDGRQRVLETVLTFLGKEEIAKGTTINVAGESTMPVVSGGFSENRSMSPKEFIYEKQPRTDVERVACLAYYLTHYRDIPHFKTLELSQLNTEAAQSKFSNAAYSMNNAVKMGYLVPASKGQKQLSAVGERFVQALPDRDAAREVMALSRPRRKNRKPVNKKAKQNNQ